MNDASDAAQLNQQPRELVATVHRVGLMVVLGFAASVVAYAVVGMIILRSRQQTEQGQVSPTFLVTVVFLTIAPIWVRRTLLAESRLRTIVTARGMAGLVKHFLRVTIICAALANAIGVLGLVAAFTGGGQRYVLIFAAVALLVLLRSYPNRQAWQRAVDYFSASTQGAARAT